MSFICGLSGKQSKPREKPVRVVLEERPTTYINVDAEGEQISTYGREIVREVDARLVAVDADKAARVEAARRPIDLALYRAHSKARFEHAAKCKKPLDECKVCKGNIDYFSTLPLAVLSQLTS